ncbi:hypothetical protein M413DRAFT_449599 [Hebeloma cylindrosporum]|uniref:F-box domain-containing protein n=1 Tax=Hebeloma cylindrosporum TaxID=76867 RepID=A0A0C2Y3X1_HEBCY|nr:hypothetical protein M413DRAFT_449599 [Hebeloma cylindrosporum h7]
MTRPKQAPTQRVLRSSKVDAQVDDLHHGSHGSDEKLSDHGNAQAKETGKPPPAKRAKKSFTAARKSSVKSPRQRKSLSLLPSMPLDVLFEVFSHLSPKDIISLSRTSRIFRDTLTTGNGISIWKAARKRLGWPECPPNMSEHQWAALLFGNTCQSCGRKSVSKPEFSLLRRICTTCRKEKLLSPSDLKTRFPNASKILKYIPRFENGWSEYHGSYWVPDIDRMLMKFAEYERNIDHDVPGAKKEFKAFKTRQYEIVMSIRKSTNERYMWWDQYVRERQSDKQAIIHQRFKLIEAKFIELGYTADDVEYIQLTPECRQPTPLTDRIWKRIRPILETDVLLYKRKRILREKEELRSTRMPILHASYQEYQKSLMPVQWKYLPRTIDICAFVPFAEILDAPADIAITFVDFEDAFRQLPQLLAANDVARKIHALSLLNNPTATLPPNSNVPEQEPIIHDPTVISSSSNSSQPDDGALELATALFTCMESPCTKRNVPQSYLFGWDDIAQHNCKSDSYYILGPPKIAFSLQASNVAAAVVRAAGLDAGLATVADMDAKTEDLRLGCSSCPPLMRDGVIWEKCGYTWRDFVSHCAIKGHTDVENSLVILTPGDAAKVKERELENVNRKNKWTCAHCAIHFGDLKFREVVVEHLKSAHGIDSPREPEDLFLFSRVRFSFETTYP